MYREIRLAAGSEAPSAQEAGERTGAE